MRKNRLDTARWCSPGQVDVIGFEPTTYCLQGSCLTIRPHTQEVFVGWWSHADSNCALLVADELCLPVVTLAPKATTGQVPRDNWPVSVWCELSLSMVARTGSRTLLSSGYEPDEETVSLACVSTTVPDLAGAVKYRWPDSNGLDSGMGRASRLAHRRDGVTDGI